MRIMAVWLCVLLLSSSPAWSTEGQEAAGIIKVVSGKVLLLPQGESTPIEAMANMRLSAGDTVRTGRDGSVGLIFKDDTVVSLGPGSEFIIEEFQFKPVKLQFSFVGRMLRGTINYISGQIAKLAPETVRLETPDATLGVRGTQVLVEVN